MLQGHLIPRRLLHILDFQWSKSFHWNIRSRTKAKGEEHVFWICLSIFKEWAWFHCFILSILLNWQETLYSHLFFLSPPLTHIPCFHATNLPHEIHATVLLDLIDQIKSWKKRPVFLFSHQTINEFPPEPSAWNCWVFLSLNFSPPKFYTQVLQNLTLQCPEESFIQGHASKLPTITLTLASLSRITYPSFLLAKYISNGT